MKAENASGINFDYFYISTIGDLVMCFTFDKIGNLLQSIVEDVLVVTQWFGSIDSILYGRK